MAKKATRARSNPTTPKISPARKRETGSRKVARAASASDFNAVDALLKLLESPLVADLLAVGATAAMAAITETRHSRKTGGDAKSTKMMKAAGVAAAAAIGRRLADEFEEIRSVSKKAKGSAKA